MLMQTIEELSQRVIELASEQTYLKNKYRFILSLLPTLDLTA